MPKDVFISYSTDDKAIANWVCESLEERGVGCWIAPRDIPPGAVFDEEIIDALNDASALVLILSAKANASPFVKNEVNHAFAKGKTIFTFRSEDVLPGRSLQLYLGRHQWTDGFPPPLEGKLDRLASAILALVGKTSKARLDPGAGSEGNLPALISSLSEVDIPGSASERFLPDAWYLPNDELLGFVEIPAGAFKMGSDRKDDEEPQHVLNLPRFWIAKFAVSVAQFRACVEAGGCKAGDKRSVHDDAELPVRYVSWREALRYCDWLEQQLTSRSDTPASLGEALRGSRDGMRHRITLPSEAEWEKAARGSEGSIYPWGGSFDAKRVNVSGGPVPVVSFPNGASPYGLVNMCGNVSELTRSKYATYPYNPHDGRESQSRPGARSTRGGSFQFGSDATTMRAANRGAFPENDRARTIGFRLALTPYLA